MGVRQLEQLLREDPDDLAARRAHREVLVDRAVARPHAFPSKAAVTWSAEAPAHVADALRARFVTAVRLRPGADAEDADQEYERDEPDTDQNDMPLPPPLHEAGALPDIDFGGIRELDLSYFRVGDPGAVGLAETSSTGRIDTLDLRYCGIGDEGIAALVASGKFGDIRRLHLQHNRLTGEGVRALAPLHGLRELDLRYNRIGADGAAALAEAPFAGSLTRLLIHREDVTDAGVRTLASASRLPSALRGFWRSV
ncbi:hypothetical protein [Streptomyces sp. NPDC058653]|uniref:hypothetical protein n=1 Tax=Streptomyces sp. NPDC058653 TaxID=3346576 RepID=UPI003657B83B